MLFLNQNAYISYQNETNTNTFQGILDSLRFKRDLKRLTHSLSKAWPNKFLKSVEVAKSSEKKFKIQLIVKHYTFKCTTAHTLNKKLTFVDKQRIYAKQQTQNLLIKGEVMLKKDA